MARTKFDLQTVLAGVPGLIVMAACAFVGATIGIALAFWLTWVKPSDAVANFLGGVVGAGLGSALAVMGAVYIQRRDERARLAPAASKLALQLEQLRTAFVLLQFEIENFKGHLEDAKEFVDKTQALQREVARFSDVFSLGRTVSKSIEGFKLIAGIHLRHLWLFLTDPTSGNAEVRQSAAVDALQRVIAHLEHTTVPIRAMAEGRDL